MCDWTPPCLEVDVRAPLLLANGCPFGICAGAHTTAAAAPVGVLPGEQLMVPTPEGSSRGGVGGGDAKRRGGGGGGGVGGVGGAAGGAEMARRVWIAAAADDASPCSRPVPVDVEPGKAPSYTVISTAAGPVEVVVSAHIWAPRGVSAAAPQPCLRATVMPALAVVNLSSAAVSVLSAAGVVHSPHRRSYGALNRLTSSRTTDG